MQRSQKLLAVRGHNFNDNHDLKNLFKSAATAAAASAGPFQQFYTALLAQGITSPVQVIVNGNPAEVLVAVGYPGSTDGCQVNFRLPADIAKGSATVQGNAAWNPSAAVTIQVQ